MSKAIESRRLVKQAAGEKEEHEGRSAMRPNCPKGRPKKKKKQKKTELSPFAQAANATIDPRFEFHPRSETGIKAINNDVNAGDKVGM